MNASTPVSTHSRRTHAIVAAAAALLALLGLLAAGLHHHEEHGTRHACAVCALAQAPAEIAPPVVPAAPAASCTESLVEVRAVHPRAATRATARPRAPPAA